MKKDTRINTIKITDRIFLQVVSPPQLLQFVLEITLEAMEILHRGQATLGKIIFRSQNSRLTVFKMHPAFYGAQHNGIVDQFSDHD